MIRAGGGASSLSNSSGRTGMIVATSLGACAVFIVGLLVFFLIRRKRIRDNIRLAGHP